MKYLAESDCAFSFSEAGPNKRASGTKTRMDKKHVRSGVRRLDGRSLNRLKISVNFVRGYEFTENVNWAQVTIL